MPLYEGTTKSKSKFETRIKPLFPGYIFVSIESEKTPWRKINSTRGVVRIICQDGKPNKVPLEIVFGLMNRCDNSGKLFPPTSLEYGDQVTVTSGALTNFVATVETIESNQRIWVLLEIMGQLTKVQVASEQLRPLI